MKNYKILFIYLLILISLNSCGSIKDGFSMQKKDNTDEFLVEKKNPLKLPPNYDELPIPNSEGSLEKEEKIKNLIVQSENGNNKQTDNKNKKNKNLEEFLLDKIKKN